MSVVARSVTHMFGGLAALNDVSFELQRGCWCGLVGTNGAGKSTLLSIVTGLVRPTAGQALIDGIDACHPDARRRLGVVSEIPELVETVSGLELLEHVGVIRSLPVGKARERARVLAELVGIPKDRRTITSYSTGNRKRAAVAAALMSPTSALALDEPLEAIDPLAAERIVDELGRYRDSGGTVMMSSHDLRLVSAVCDRVLVMSHGRLVADISPGGELSAEGLLETLRQHA